MEEVHSFFRPRHSHPTSHLLLGNVGGLDASSLQQLLAPHGAVAVVLAGPGRSHAYASFATPDAAAAALHALDGAPSPAGGVRALVARFAEARQQKAHRPPAQLSAVLSAEEAGVPGLELHPDFVSLEEEAELLALADTRPWQALAKRRVQHYGYEFHYESRNVDRSKPPARPIPSEVLPIIQRIQALPNSPKIDQLTVNEYTPGVGLAPHIDTHSAFSGSIISLSLGAPAVMVLRREGVQRAVALPPRALLVMGCEARYAWEHYIPHRKSDVVAGQVVARGPRRVSFTFRQARGFSCDCAYPQYCDSQDSTLPPTRVSIRRGCCSSSDGSSSSSATRPSAGGTEVRWLSPEGVLAGSTTPEGSGAGQQQGQQRHTEEQREAEQPLSLVSGPPTPSSRTASANPPSCSGPSTHQAGSATDGGGGGGGGGGGSRGESALGLGDVEGELRRLEEQFVHSVYDAIAPHFSATRFAVWPRVRAFIEALPAGGMVADVGCGNGKYFGVRRDIFVLGSDRSQGLAAVAARRLQPGPLDERLRADVAVADALRLPYRPACCDGVLCIAVLHHISSTARRLRLLGQLLELLVPGGRALVTVWATEQENMAKVAKWQPISTPAAGAAAAVQAQPPCYSAASADAAAAAAGTERQGAGPPAGEVLGAGGPGASASTSAGAEVSSGDYFVPWHLPFHRAEAAAAAAAENTAAGLPQQEQSDALSSFAPPILLPGTATVALTTAAAAAAPGAPAGGAPLVDRSKGAVVYQRYYHLFEGGELDALVGQLPGARMVESFYDKDNWCVVLERV